MPIPDVLRGERVRLTPLTPDDAPTLAHWYQHGDFMRDYDTIPAVPKTEAQLSKAIEQANESTDQFVFGIRRLDDDLLIGRFELDGIEWPHRRAFLSLLILDPQLRGQGYGDEAMRIGLRFAFHEINLHRVALTVFAYNARAIALYERLGFVYEGNLRESFERDGERHDMLLYGLLRHEWE